jgi:hypothetical protein
MNKESFMQELARLLGDISPQERQEALNFYEEYFHDAGPEKEQEVLKELGSPMQVAAKIKEGLDATVGVENGPQTAENNAAQGMQNNSGGAAYTEQEPPKKHSVWKTIGLVFLIICASPLLLAFASVIGVYHGHGFTANFTPDYLMTYCKNFIMAFPLQLIFVGPLARLIFRTLFINHKKEKNTNEIQNDDEKIVAKTM